MTTQHTIRTPGRAPRPGAARAAPVNSGLVNSGRCISLNRRRAICAVADRASSWLSGRVFGPAALAVWTRQLAGLVSAGLPLEGGRLTPSLFERAAARAGLSSRVVARRVLALNLVRVLKARE